MKKFQGASILKTRLIQKRAIEVTMGIGSFHVTKKLNLCNEAMVN